MSTKLKKHHYLFYRIITAPIRALSKARNSYEKSMSKYAARVAGSNDMAYPPEASMPRSLSTSTILRSGGEDGDDYRELVRAASARTYGHKNELEMYLNDILKQQQVRLQTNVSVRAPVMTIIEEGEEENEGSSKKAK